MTIQTKRDMFERELKKLYHAELEILDLHGDLSAAAASEEVSALFAAHREDTVAQIDRIERAFAAIGLEPEARSSQIMEGLVAEKDEFVNEVEDGDLRDLDAIGIGSINERFEITILDRLLLLAEELDLPPEVAEALAENRAEAASALERMQGFVERTRRDRSA
jgi:ferritin-like metal-binding protein YciE